MTKAQEVIGALVEYTAGAPCPVCDGLVIEAITNRFTRQVSGTMHDWPGIGDVALCTVCKWSQPIPNRMGIDWGRRGGKTLMRDYQGFLNANRS